jgi:hypothetical protein
MASISRQRTREGHDFEIACLRNTSFLVGKADVGFLQTPYAANERGCLQIVIARILHEFLLQVLVGLKPERMKGSGRRLAHG